ncbi:MAG TPA: hypothetical protein VL990_13520 [Acidobacteriaceae bacterium]|nr:hypothetical protein [Acidobacteriaceae bacterium]
MSAAPAVPCVVAEATAVADAELPSWRSKPIEGLAFYRKHCVALLRRYLQTSLEIGRSPSLLSNVVLRGRVSSYRIRSFEDGMIFVLDVEKCLMRLDRVSRTVVARMALEDFTGAEAAILTGESLRSVVRIYHGALDRLTSNFLENGLLDSNVENLSRGEGKVESNDAT